MKNEFKCNSQDSHQITGEENKGNKKGETHKKPKTINKMTIRTYKSIITLKVNRQNASIKS